MARELKSSTISDIFCKTTSMDPFLEVKSETGQVPMLTLTNQFTFFISSLYLCNAKTLLRFYPRPFCRLLVLSWLVSQL